MFVAQTPTGERIAPTRRDDCVCPVCGEPVVARLGDMVVHHWAHRPGAVECDTWSEGPSEWHRYWQSAVTLDRREVVIGRHRADALLPGGAVMEVQHSSIPAWEAQERTRFYAEHTGMRAVWMVDARETDLRFTKADGRFRAFRWRHPIRWVLPLVPQATVLLDLGDSRGVLALGKASRLKVSDARTVTGGWGHLYDRASMWAQLGLWIPSSRLNQEAS